MVERSGGTLRGFFIGANEMYRRTYRAVVVAASLLAVACATTEPEVDDTLDYEPTKWLITGAINADALAEGATLSLVLRVGGRVTGALFIPASVTGGDDLTADMAGSWSKTGDTVRFSQVSRTFVSEVAWLLTPEMLLAADSSNGSFYDVELTRVFR